MIKFADRLWVGNSSDATSAEVECILNVARDLKGVRGWPGMEYAQVGLVDGPGNTLSSYCAAALALHALMETGKRVLVHCHEGKSRSVVVALMYMNLTAQRNFDDLLKLVCERIDTNLPSIHEAHKVAFDKIDWQVLSKLLRN